MHIYKSYCKNFNKLINLFMLFLIFVQILISLHNSFNVSFNIVTSGLEKFKVLKKTYLCKLF